MIVESIPGVDLIHEPQQKTLIQNWTGFISSENFRLAIDKSVEFFAKNDVKYLISDTLKQNVVSPKDVNYAASTMPNLAKFGMQHMAFVMSEQALTNMSVKRFSRVSEDSNIAYFETRELALEWIENILKTNP